MKGGKLWEFGDNWDNSQIDVNHLLMPANISRIISMYENQVQTYKYKYISKYKYKYNAGQLGQFSD